MSLFPGLVYNLSVLQTMVWGLDCVLCPGQGQVWILPTEYKEKPVSSDNTSSCLLGLYCVPATHFFSNPQDNLEKVKFYSFPLEEVEA